MSDFDRAQDQEERAREIADATRRYLVAINSGAVIVLLGLAGALASECVPPGWVVWPAVVFSASILVTGFSLGYAKRKALWRRDAYRAEEEPPPFDCTNAMRLGKVLRSLAS